MIFSQIQGFRVDFTDQLGIESKKFFLADYSSEHELAALCLAKQVHGVYGYEIDALNELSVRESEADFLVVTDKKKAVVVETADCLPIVLYALDDNKKTVGLSVIHAGWRGALAGITEQAVKKLQETLVSNNKNNSKTHNTGVFTLHYLLGPAAGSCCYEVQHDFIERLSLIDYVNGQRDNLLSKREGRWYFDNNLFIMKQLESLGVTPSIFARNYNFCTIHDTRFYSYRRQKDKAGRQFTIAYLLE